MNCHLRIVVLLLVTVVATVANEAVVAQENGRRQQNARKPSAEVLATLPETVYLKNVLIWQDASFSQLRVPELSFKTAQMTVAEDGTQYQEVCVGQYCFRVIVTENPGGGFVLTVGDSDSVNVQTLPTFSRASSGSFFYDPSMVNITYRGQDDPNVLGRARGCFDISW